MRIPRFSLNSIIASVIVIAFDCSAVRSILSRWETVNGMYLLLLAAILPMINILACAIALMVQRSGRGWYSLLGFQVSGWGAVVATILGFGPSLVALEWLLDRLGIPSHISSSTFWMPIIAGSFCALFLILQVLLACAGGLIASRLAARFRSETKDDFPTTRLQPISIAVLAILLAIPTLGLEAYLQLTRDRKYARLEPGSIAFIDDSSMWGIRAAGIRGQPEVKIPNGIKVQIGADFEESQLVIFDVKERGEWQSDMRLVQVTQIDGEQKSEKALVPRYLLRPNR